MVHLAPRSGLALHLLLVLLGISGCTEDKRPRTESSPVRDAGAQAQEPEIPGDWNRPLRGPLALVALPENGTDGGGRALVELQHLPADHRLLYLLGKRVVDNRYSSTVIVETDGPAIPASCNGIFIHPRLVLTASHCVCPWQESRTSEGSNRLSIDGTNCTTRAKVTAIRYALIEEGSWSKLHVKTYGGDVRPHPDFKLVRETQPPAVTSNANLAVIVLDEPDSLGLPIVPLAKTEARTGDTLVIVGHGNDKVIHGEFGNRYIKKGEVKSASQSLNGKVIFEPEGMYLPESYQGWACLREIRGDRQLAGIMGLGTETEMFFTSTYFYRNWLRSELQRAAAAPPRGKLQ
jgi:hypothetical protein